MGTHPIFESDFDCLTAMSSNPPPMPPLPPTATSASKPPSEIPTGPDASKKDFTHGWNDPPAEIKKVTSDNPLRRKKEKKTATTAPPLPQINAFNPSSS